MGNFKDLTGMKFNMLDRIDTNGNYSPDNCRWVDDVAQANNRRHPDKVKNQYGAWDYRNPPEPYRPEKKLCDKRL